MANSASARKRAKQTDAKNLLRKAQRSEARTGIRAVIKLIESDSFDASKAKSKFIEVTGLLDRLANKSVLHANTVARLKSRLNKRLKLATEKLEVAV